MIRRRVLDDYECCKNSLHTPKDIAECRFVPCNCLILEKSNNFVKGIGVVKYFCNKSFERWMPIPHGFHDEGIVIRIGSTGLEINKKRDTPIKYFKNESISIHKTFIGPSVFTTFISQVQHTSIIKVIPQMVDSRIIYAWPTKCFFGM